MSAASARGPLEDAGDPTSECKGVVSMGAGQVASASSDSEHARRSREACELAKALLEDQLTHFVDAWWTPASEEALFYRWLAEASTGRITGCRAVAERRCSSGSAATFVSANLAPAQASGTAAVPIRDEETARPSLGSVSASAAAQELNKRIYCEFRLRSELEIARWLQDRLRRTRPIPPCPRGVHKDERSCCYLVLRDAAGRNICEPPILVRHLRQLLEAIKLDMFWLYKTNPLHFGEAIFLGLPNLAVARNICNNLKLPKPRFPENNEGLLRYCDR